MPPPSPPSPIDPAALARQLRRMAHAEGPPWLHQEVARRMAERLAVIKQPPQQWLQWSGHLGGGRAEVSQLWPQAMCTVVEPTAALAARSRQAVKRPWWALGRPAAPVLAPDDLPEGQAQMLWANMVLHASPDATVQLAQWHRALAVGGFLMFSTYGPDTLAELRALYAEAGWPAPLPRYVDMHDIGDALVHAGFADPVMDQETLRLSWSGPQALLAELRSLGGHLGRDRYAGLRTPRWQQRLCDALARRAAADGRITMRVELVYGHAYKSAPRPARGQTAVVSLDSLRRRVSAGQQGQPGAEGA